MPNITERRAITDIIEGVFIAHAGHHAIVLDADFVGEEVVHRGQLILRYGLQYLGRPQYCLVPDLVVLDYGEAFVGEEAWAFLLNRSNLYPRADVFGYRNDGVDDMTVVKKLDLAIPPEVLVYASVGEHVALGRTQALIGDAPTLPEGLFAYCQRYDNLTLWQEEVEKNV